MTEIFKDCHGREYHGHCSRCGCDDRPADRICEKGESDLLNWCDNCRRDYAQRHAVTLKGVDLMFHVRKDDIMRQKRLKTQKAKDGMAASMESRCQRLHRNYRDAYGLPTFEEIRIRCDKIAEDNENFWKEMNKQEVVSI